MCQWCVSLRLEPPPADIRQPELLLTLTLSKLSTHWTCTGECLLWQTLSLADSLGKNWSTLEEWVSEAEMLLVLPSPLRHTACDGNILLCSIVNLAGIAIGSSLMAVVLAAPEMVDSLVPSPPLAPELVDLLLSGPPLLKDCVPSDILTHDIGFVDVTVELEFSSSNVPSLTLSPVENLGTLDKTGSSSFGTLRFIMSFFFQSGKITMNTLSEYANKKV